MKRCRDIKSLVFFLLTFSLCFAIPCYPFSSPCHEPVWEIGTNQVVAWETSATVYNISFFQQNLTVAAAIAHVNVFLQLYGFDLSASNVFFFWINHGVNNANWTSSYFTITDRSPLPTSTVQTSLPANTAQTSPSTTTAQTSLSPKTTQPSLPINTGQTALATDASQLSSASSGLSTQKKVGLGVGLAIGVSLLASLAINAILFYRRKRYSTSLNTNHRTGLSSENGWQAWTQEGFVQKLETPTSRHGAEMPELPASHRIELSSP
ncbi:hypothetical protein PISL3812_02131 [Talaromyces islandicus]|uniref:Mid2 domain-containing protein n=1 Tax=Talaromyces islandicus TaxID=28573 RepID=A0A0U1LP27_TALIS|nr:hypothetical protein PISL3812_02131 [Talaromyces islandicus]